MWSLPGPGIEPGSPALADGFLSTVAPGESFRFGIEFTFHHWLSLSSPSISPRQNTYLKAGSAVLYLLGASKAPQYQLLCTCMVLNSSLISASWEFPFCLLFLPSAFSAFSPFCLPFSSCTPFSIVFSFSISMSVVEGESSLAHSIM